MSDPIEITLTQTPPIELSVSEETVFQVSIEEHPEISVTIEEPSAADVTVAISQPADLTIELPAENVIDLEVTQPPAILVQIMEAGESTGVSGWVTLKDSWTTAPVLIDTIAAGEVYQYAYGATIYYRLVPSPYDSSLDQFFSTFSSHNLSGLIVTRAQPI